jgi:hypothetical protein
VRARFLTAAVPSTVQSVRPDELHQRAAWTLISKGSIAFDDQMIELIARAKRPANSPLARWSAVPGRVISG